MANYKATIVTTSREISAKERIQLKDTTGAIRLDEATAEAPVIIKPTLYAHLHVQNDNSDSGEYENYIFVDEETGERYVTGSNSLWRSFTDIAEEMEDSDEEWMIKIYRVPSKNYKGKDFLTCSII